MKKKIILTLFTLVTVFLITACGSKRLSGEYTTTINMLFAETKNTLTFDGDKVTEMRTD